MKDPSDFQELSNIDFNKTPDISDYDSLLRRLREIKDNIALLENHILYR
tara:strand:- start:115 stop:261 length:147 start_codon:yes stop_codon:yes gene_type:complete